MQHLDLMAAQSMARERERQTQADLLHRESARRRTPNGVPVEPAPRSWWRDVLVRLRLVNAPLH
ncbi:hypothetical protein [Ornithinimicrobium sediminis]|uniref:hypothetical protein n=1 Tax=Ornithinimicrobium sediminis TaxID=2904603 RepID=UPI001E53F553|nr:hypothetical protein [Ornithinimicrobium sediminis]MCE0487259.1 hypothetical protein [Ornithinimicrobium sediminis]